MVEFGLICFSAFTFLLISQPKRLQAKFSRNAKGKCWAVQMHEWGQGIDESVEPTQHANAHTHTHTLTNMSRIRPATLSGWHTFHGEILFDLPSSHRSLDNKCLAVAPVANYICEGSLFFGCCRAPMEHSNGECLPLASSFNSFEAHKMDLFCCRAAELGGCVCVRCVRACSTTTGARRTFSSADIKRLSCYLGAILLNRANDKCR